MSATPMVPGDPKLIAVDGLTLVNRLFLSQVVCQTSQISWEAIGYARARREAITVAAFIVRE